MQTESDDVGLAIVCGAGQSDMPTRMHSLARNAGPCRHATVAALLGLERSTALHTQALHAMHLMVCRHSCLANRDTSTVYEAQLALHLSACYCSGARFRLMCCFRPQVIGKCHEMLRHSMAERHCSGASKYTRAEGSCLRALGRPQMLKTCFQAYSSKLCACCEASGAC